MLCKDPITVFSNPQAFNWTSHPEGKFGEYRTFPCGRCRNCRWLMTRQWALRCSLEAEMHEQSCFVNLTYAPEHLPENGSLVVADLQKFVKRLRAHVDYHHDIKIRFYAAGEYGEQNGRPHYHVIVFGYSFPNQYYWRTTRRDFKLYRSDEAEALWPFGHVEIGSVTFKSAGYVAGYIRKKVNGPKAGEHYSGRIPEFALMSKKPPIGYSWLKANPWIWREDLIRAGGKSYRPPFAFEMIFKKEDPEGYEKWVAQVKSQRKPLDVRGDSADDFADEADLLDEAGD